MATNQIEDLYFDELLVCSECLQNDDCLVLEKIRAQISFPK